MEKLEKSAWKRVRNFNRSIIVPKANCDLDNQ